MHDLLRRQMHQIILLVRLDPLRVGVVGLSSGGHSALMLAATTAASCPEFEGEGGHSAFSSDVQSCVAWFCNVDMVGNPYFGSMMEESASDSDAAKASPIHHVTGSPGHGVSPRADFPPTCMLCGAADEQVDPQDSLDMYTALQRQGIQSELHLLAQTAHSDGEFRLRSQEISQARVPLLVAFWLAALTAASPVAQ